MPDAQPTINGRRRSPTRVASAARVMGRGFSLVELAMVLASLGILALIAVPKYGMALSRYRIEAAAGRVASDLRLLKATAQAQSTTCAITFDTVKDTYTMSGVAPTDLRDKFGNYKVDLSGDPYFVDIEKIELTGSGTFSFDAWGKSSGGVLVCLVCGNESRIVAYDATSQQVSVVKP